MKATTRLKSVDWDFADYRGFATLPSDINSIHWYPAPFVPQIPAILIQALTLDHDLILDPFAGTGVTAVEATRLGRRFVATDINPAAVNILRAKFIALKTASAPWLERTRKDVESLDLTGFDPRDYCRRNGIANEVERWFEPRTLSQVCSLHAYATSARSSSEKLLRKVLLSSILNRCCSQREHYTYITDSCYPKQLHHVDATKQFLQQAELITLASRNFKRQYREMHGEPWKPNGSTVALGDARNLDFLGPSSVDAVVTSPPYIGVNDYVRSMRLTWLFFPDQGAAPARANEIGARRDRTKPAAYERYMADMRRAFSEIARVLKPEGYFCLVIGQSRGKVSRGTAVDQLLLMLRDEFGFEQEGSFAREIRFRRIQTHGRSEETIFVLRRSTARKGEAYG